MARDVRDPRPIHMQATTTPFSGTDCWVNHTRTDQLKVPGAAATTRPRVCVCVFNTIPDCHAVDQKERSIQQFARILQNTVYDSFESRQVRRQQERKKKKF